MIYSAFILPSQFLRITGQYNIIPDGYSEGQDPCWALLDAVLCRSDNGKMSSMTDVGTHPITPGTLDNAIELGPMQLPVATVGRVAQTGLAPRAAQEVLAVRDTGRIRRHPNSLWQSDEAQTRRGKYSNISIRSDKAFVSVSPDVALLLAMSMRVEGQSLSEVETEVMIPRYLWRGEEYEVNIDCSSGSSVFHWQSIKFGGREEKLNELMVSLNVVATPVTADNIRQNAHAIRLAISVLSIWRTDQDQGYWRRYLINIGTDEIGSRETDKVGDVANDWWAFSIEQTRYSYAAEWLNVIGEESYNVPTLWKSAPKLVKRTTYEKSRNMLRNNTWESNGIGDAGFWLMFECVAGIIPDGRPLAVAGTLMDQWRLFNENLNSKKILLGGDEVSIFRQDTRCPYLFRPELIALYGITADYQIYMDRLETLAESDPQGTSIGNAALGQLVNLISPRPDLGEARTFRRSVERLVEERRNAEACLDWRLAIAFSLTQTCLQWSWSSDVHRWRGQLGTEVLIG
jgi:hypothetical protein